MVLFNWDRKKAQSNLHKHLVSFEEAKTVFLDPFALTFADEHHSDEEERYLTLGISSRGRALLVIHMQRWDEQDTLIIRLISCRKATSAERKKYEEGEK
jgi:uncharacterized DUF497 family protein